MAAEVLMPKLGASMESGTIIRWFKKEGDPVQAGDILMDVMTDKINIEVEAETSGILLKVLYQENEEVSVNQVIAYIGQAGEQIALISEPSKLTDVPVNDTGTASEWAVDQDPSFSNEKIRATPAARKLAHDAQLDLHQIKGTGPNGRIQRDDVEQLVENPANRPKVTHLAEKIAREEQVNLAEVRGTGVQGKIVSQDVLAHSRENLQQIQTDADAGNTVRVEGIRKIIARRMVESAFTAPHVTLVTEVDMSHGIKLREQLLPTIEKKTGYRLSFTEIIMKAAAHALRNHPRVNASLQGEYIVLHSQINIGLAVAVSDGLLVPVIRDCDRKGLAALTKECKMVGRSAQENKLSPDQMSGGTFTISNLGMYEVDAFTPIINQPESAILGVGRIKEKPVGVNGAIELRSIMTLSFSFDHRVIDGAPAAAFLTELKEILENPLVMLA